MVDRFGSLTDAVAIRRLSVGEEGNTISGSRHIDWTDYAVTTCPVLGRVVERTAGFDRFITVHCESLTWQR